MKKWIYFIIPIIGLGVFLFFYFAHVEDAKRQDAIHKIEQDKKAADELAKKKELEAQARRDADRLAAERAAEEQKKLDERIARQKEEDQKVIDERDRALVQCDEYRKQIAASEKQLSELRASKEKNSREFLEISKQLEEARIVRRNAELEVQRTTEVIARKASDSAMAKYSPPATEKK